MTRQRKKTGRRILLVILFLYAALCLGMAINQRAFIYLPFSGPIDPQEAGLHNFSKHQFTDENDINIVYWESTTHHKNPLLFYFHGNGGGLHQFVPNLQYLEQQGFHVVAMEYRGYPGAPEGKSETNIVGDGIALIDHFNAAYPTQKRAIWGYSLGTGIATQIAAKRAPDALILEAPFSALVDRAAELYPFLPTKYLVRDTYLSRTAITQTHAPVMILHGDQDRIIPPHHAQDLYNAASEPKLLKIYPGFGHIGLREAGAYNDATAFINNHLKP